MLEGRSLTTPGQPRKDTWWLKKEPNQSQIQNGQVKLEPDQAEEAKNDIFRESDASTDQVKKNLQIEMNSQFDLSAVLMVSYSKNVT